MERIRRKLANRLDRHGNLRVVSSKYRLQGQNLEAALDRMEALIQEALVRPRKRIPTGPTGSSRQQRLAAKKQRGRLKRDRGAPSPED